MLDACLERVTRHRHFYALTLGFCRQMISRMRTSSSDMSVAMVDKKKYSATGPSILSSARDGGRSSASGGDHHERLRVLKIEAEMRSCVRAESREKLQVQ